MICKNCRKGMNTQTVCQSCGYNAAIDDSPNPNKPVKNMYDVTVPPVQIKRLKGSNGCATTGLIFGILSIVPIYPWPFAFIFSLIGFFKAKNARSGRVRAVIGFLLPFIWLAGYVALAYFLNDPAISDMLRNMGMM